MGMPLDQVPPDLIDLGAGAARPQVEQPGLTRVPLHPPEDRRDPLDYRPGERFALAGDFIDGGDLAGDPIHRGGDQGLLGTEIVVHGGSGHPGLRCDFEHTGPVDPLIGEDPDRGVDDPATPVGNVGGADGEVGFVERGGDQGASLGALVAAANQDRGGAADHHFVVALQSHLTRHQLAFGDGFDR